MNITELPPLVLRKIFSYLDWNTLQCSATLTCTDWFQMIREDPKFSTSVAIKLFVKLDTIKEILNHWPKLKILTLRRDLSYLDKYHPKKDDFKDFPNLEKIIFDGRGKHRTYTKENYMRYIERSWDFKHIRIECEYFSIKPQDQIEGSIYLMEFSVAHGPPANDSKSDDFDENLRFDEAKRMFVSIPMKAEQVEAVYERCFRMLEKAVNLKTLSIGEDGYEWDRGFCAWQKFLEHASRHETLENLSVCNHDCCVDAFNVDCDILGPITRFPSLKSLKLSEMDIREAQFSTARKNNIEEVELSNCELESVDVFEKLAQAFPALKKLKVVGDGVMLEPDPDLNPIVHFFEALSKLELKSVECDWTLEEPDEDYDDINDEDNEDEEGNSPSQWEKIIEDKKEIVLDLLAKVAKDCEVTLSLKHEEEDLTFKFVKAIGKEPVLL